VFVFFSFHLQFCSEITVFIISYHLITSSFNVGEQLGMAQWWPGFDSRIRRHMWVEFVVGSRAF